MFLKGQDSMVMEGCRRMNGGRNDKEQNKKDERRMGVMG